MRAFGALMPLAMLGVSKLILDAVAAWISRHSGSVAGIWKLVALELGLAVLGNLRGRANSLCDRLLGDGFISPTGQRGANEARHRSGPTSFVRGPGLLRQVGTRPPSDHRHFALFVWWGPRSMSTGA